MLDERLCDHGCGRVARFVNKSERHVCEKSSNKCPSVRKRNSEGLKKAHSEGRVPSPSSEMRERSVLSKQREAIERKFVKGSKSSGAWIKEMLFKHFGWEEKCKECGFDSGHEHHKELKCLLNLKSQRALQTARARRAEKSCDNNSRT